MQNDGQNLHIKPHQHVSKNRAKIHDFGAKGVPKFSRSAPKAILEASRFPGPQKVSAPDAFFEPFGDNCAILAAIGPSWAPRGFQNRAFWHQVLSKTMKMMSKGRSQKKIEILIKNRSENVSF